MLPESESPHIERIARVEGAQPDVNGQCRSGCVWDSAMGGLLEARLACSAVTWMQMLDRMVESVNLSGVWRIWVARNR